MTSCSGLSRRSAPDSNRNCTRSSCYGNLAGINNYSSAFVIMIDKHAKLYIAGHRGMVGSALLRIFRRNGFDNIVTRTSQELDLRCEAAVADFFARERPVYVLLAAAKVGGIAANQQLMADFLLDNLQIQNHVISYACRSGVQKFCFFGSNCAYPLNAPQPILEDSLLCGPLEPTNEGYALAKIAGLKLGLYLSRQYAFNCINVIPCSLYGENDNFALPGCHVLAALVRKFCDAVAQDEHEVVCWGSGQPLREFMAVDDLAEAVFFLFHTRQSAEIINIGSGREISIRELAELIAAQAGFKGIISWDLSRPDGMPRKFLDSGQIRSLGWRPRIPLEEGIAALIREYRTVHLSCRSSLSTPPAG